MPYFNGQDVENVYKILIIVTLLFMTQALHAEESVSSGLFKYHLNFATEGSPESIYIIASMYEHGRGVEQNYKQAIKWYRKAEQLGNTRAAKDLKNIRNILALREKEKRQKEAQKEIAESMPPTAPVVKETKKTAIINKNNQAIRKITITKPVTRSTNPTASIQNTPPAPLITPRVNEQTMSQRQQQIELDKLRTETETARLKSELAQARNEQLEREKASLVLQIELEKELAREQSRKTIEQQVIPDASINVQETKDKEFNSDPCDGPSAKFMSTCR